jgi:hypothetical protein
LAESLSASFERLPSERTDEQARLTTGVYVIESTRKMGMKISQFYALHDRVNTLGFLNVL